ncbi:MAG: type I-C CRISPR-associated protein Cas7/Csd2 [Deltaproteobacteria bacterium]|nr:type I-C CRISPR-associated protein Cas7/Csd2 [Deltaproteobacteria bacterium]
MNILSNKIDFAVILRVVNANPNGDPLNGNRPRTDFNHFGEISDVCIKRKIRDRLLEQWVENGRQNDGNMVFVQSEDRNEDGAKSLRERAEAVLGKQLGSDKTVDIACEKWIDVRSFGQLFAMKSAKKTSKKNTDENFDGDTGISVGIRGPVSIQSAFSVEPVDITSMQITKSVSAEGDGSKRGSDTMGMKHRIDQGTYVFYGSMNPQLAMKTKFSDQDAEIIKNILPQLFENDESSARPAGSMEVLKVIWWKHDCKSGQYSSAKVHRSLRVKPDGGFDLDGLRGLEPEIITGF